MVQVAVAGKSKITSAGGLQRSSVDDDERADGLSSSVNPAKNSLE
jgi:hypothetical protein